MARGGYRPGSGPKKGTKYRPRKKKEPLAATEGKTPSKPEATQDLDPGDFLRATWNNPAVEVSLRIRAAEVVFRVIGEKKGKKEVKAEKAKVAGYGRFAASAPPLKLVK